MMQEELDIPIADEGLCQVPQAALTRENRQSYSHHFAVTSSIFDHQFLYGIIQ